MVRRLAVIICLAVAATVAPLTARAQSNYTVSIDTSTLSGTQGLLAFDLIGGDAMMANNTASVFGLTTDGTLSSLAPFSLTDTAFFNEELRSITFGTFTRFTVGLTENVTAPGLDQFSFFLVDPLSMLPLFSTTDSVGADALFAIDITGLPGGDRSVFDSLTGGPTWQVAAVPDSG
jgi:hypothetical protein